MLEDSSQCWYQQVFVRGKAAAAEENPLKKRLLDVEAVWDLAEEGARWSAISLWSVLRGYWSRQLFSCCDDTVLYSCRAMCFPQQVCVVCVAGFGNRLELIHTIFRAWSANTFPIVSRLLIARFFRQPFVLSPCRFGSHRTCVGSRSGLENVLLLFFGYSLFHWQTCARSDSPCLLSCVDQLTVGWSTHGWNCWSIRLPWTYISWTTMFQCHFVEVLLLKFEFVKKLGFFCIRVNLRTSYSE